MSALAAESGGAPAALSKAQQKKLKEKRQRLRKQMALADLMYKGRRCVVSKNGVETLATVVKVHRDDPEELYITVQDDEGQEKQTLLARTRPATDEDVEDFARRREAKAAADAEAAAKREAEARRQAEDALIADLGGASIGDAPPAAKGGKKRHAGGRAR